MLEETIFAPSVLKFADVTTSEWPSSNIKQTPDVASHTLAV